MQVIYTMLQDKYQKGKKITLSTNKKQNKKNELVLPSFILKDPYTPLKSKLTHMQDTQLIYKRCSDKYKASRLNLRVKRYSKFITVYVYYY